MDAVAELVPIQEAYKELVGYSWDDTSINVFNFTVKVCPLVNSVQYFYSSFTIPGTPQPRRNA